MKNTKKTSFFDDFFFNFDGFLKIVQFWINHSAPNLQIWVQWILVHLLTPLGPLGACQYWKEIYLCPTRHCAYENFLKTSRTKNGHYSSLCSYSPSSMPFDFYSGNSLKVLGYVRIDFWPEKKIRPSKSFIALLNKLCFFLQ